MAFSGVSAISLSLFSLLQLPFLAGGSVVTHHQGRSKVNKRQQGGGSTFLDHRLELLATWSELRLGC